MDTQRICSVEGCGKRHKGHGLCNSHNERRRLYGDDFSRAPLRTFIDDTGLFAAAVLADADACVPWPRCISKAGYGMLRVNGKTALVHRLMCERTHGPAPPKHDAAHSCGIRACFNPHHLRWATRAENCADTISHGMTTRGEKHAFAKLCASDVRAIRSIYASGGTSQVELSRRYGVNQQTIGSIVKRIKWAWLD